MDVAPGVSIIVPTINREDFLGNTVKDLLAQDYQDFEIIVIDQSEQSSKALAPLIGQEPKLRYFHVNFRGLPLARNFGWQNAKNDFMIYIDDDIRCQPDFIKQHMKHLSSTQVGMVAGGITEPDVSGRSRPSFNYWTATPHPGFDGSDEGLVDSVKGCNFSIRKCLFAEFGGFDEALTKGAALYEETEFCLRLRNSKWKIYFSPAAHLDHLVAPSGGCRVKDINKYLWSLSRNRAILISRYLSTPQKVTASIRLILLIASYLRSYRTLTPIPRVLSGFKEGWIIGRDMPIVTINPPS